ncbi:MAG TPA: HopJ type III effector protein [Puia sp.]
MNITTLLEQLRTGSLAFSDVLAAIDASYQHHPTAFKNGSVYNEATQNQGSARIFSYAMLNHLSEEDTLLLFAEHYRAVLDHPGASDHQNIRQFMANGWNGIVFEGQALTAR